MQEPAWALTSWPMVWSWASLTPDFYQVRTFGHLMIGKDVRQVGW